ncbi:MAG: FIST N-terminal domain-containing protein [Rhodocyclaceae bacterium]|nr:FIST N-terminal domain-containing protein [Rhodocyclaceae bacterium]MDZ4213309.1 FIST N-terminal domain-containing protein [Rhodocyclaceae bacterium]
MRVQQVILKSPQVSPAAFAALADINPNLVTVFGAVAYFADEAFLAALRQTFPAVVLIGCSTAGEISADGVTDNTCIVTAACLEKTRIKSAVTRLAGMDDSQAAGARIGEALAGPDLKAILVFGPGVEINGSALVEGMASKVGDTVPITGGLAGDGGAFARTFTLGPDGVDDRAVVAIGLSGDALRFGHGSFGGWEPFGPARKVTRAVGNVLYELDGEPALEIYKRYLGDLAVDLPASGLLFPFAMLGDDHGAMGLIRTILGIDEAAGSLTLAGAIDPNGYLKLMHASTDSLVNGAEAAAEAAAAMMREKGESLAILVSCVGRKLVMGGRVDDEVEAVADVLGSGALLTGFYSYGEISPFTPGSACQLHNQTMTITCIGEQ